MPRFANAQAPSTSRRAELAAPLAEGASAWQRLLDEGRRELMTGDGSRLVSDAFEEMQSMYSVAALETVAQPLVCCGGTAWPCPPALATHARFVRMATSAAVPKRRFSIESFTSTGPHSASSPKNKGLWQRTFDVCSRSGSRFSVTPRNFRKRSWLSARIYRLSSSAGSSEESRCLRSILVVSLCDALDCTPNVRGVPPAMPSCPGVDPRVFRSSTLHILRRCGRAGATVVQVDHRSLFVFAERGDIRASCRSRGDVNCPTMSTNLTNLSFGTLAAETGITLPSLLQNLLETGRTVYGTDWSWKDRMLRGAAPFASWYDFEWLEARAAQDEIERWLNPRAQHERVFLPFAQSGAGDAYCLMPLDEQSVGVALIWHDDESSRIAYRSFEDFVVARYLETFADLSHLERDFTEDEIHKCISADVSFVSEWMSEPLRNYLRAFCELPLTQRAFRRGPRSHPQQVPSLISQTQLESELEKLPPTHTAPFPVVAAWELDPI